MFQKNPNIIFLYETPCKQGKFERAKRSLGLEGMFAIDYQGQGGGIAMLWRNQEEVSVQTYSNNHVDVLVFRLTGLYGKPNRARKRHTWDLIRHLND